MAAILFGPILLGLLAGIVGPRLMDRTYDMTISCYVIEDEAENNEKLANAIEGIFANLESVEEITSIITTESVILEISLNSLDEITSTTFIDDQIKTIVGERLVELKIDF